jgi:hypothetical protein
VNCGVVVAEKPHHRLDEEIRGEIWGRALESLESKLCQDSGQLDLHLGIVVIFDACASAHTS